VSNLREWHRAEYLETSVAAGTLWDYHWLQISCVLPGVACLPQWLETDTCDPKRESLPINIADSEVIFGEYACRGSSGGLHDSDRGRHRPSCDLADGPDPVVWPRPSRDRVLDHNTLKLLNTTKLLRSFTDNTFKFLRNLSFYR
jgi:hypothetical protein